MQTKRASNIKCDRLWRNARIATMAAAGIIENGAIACQDGRILYVGSTADCPEFDATETIDCTGRLVTPGLIDCHTHLIYAGNRSNEFEQKLAGVTYQEIARSGGGIMASVRATRAATKAELVQSALPRLDAFLSEGVTSIEIKSGYGLNLEDELKMLSVARELAQLRHVNIKTSLLAAHALPPEYSNNADLYIEYICEEIIPAAANAGLADAVDGYCEGIGFSPKQIEKIFKTAKAHNLKIKLHAEQFSNLMGAALAAKYGALSADHLEYLDEEGIKAMAAAGTVAVLLPGAYYFTRETKLPPIEKLRAANVPIALSSDCNPGTSPLTSLLLTMNMGAILFGLKIDECLAGVTREAARALGILDETGTIEPRKTCDLAIWDAARPAELVYNMGASPLYQRIWRGQ